MSITGQLTRWAAARAALMALLRALASVLRSAPRFAPRYALRSDRMPARRSARVTALPTTLLAALLSAAALPAGAASADGSPRVALVIGNGAYRSAPLANPANDARAMSDALERLGFRVIRLQDASQQQMFQAVRSFGDALKGGVGLFYYAGHGVQVKGRNFLVPVDARIEREDELPYKAFDVGLVIEKMDAARNPLNIVILDACRNNPFVASSRSVGGGLAQMDAPSGSLIAFATAPGATAEDSSDGGRSSNGLYTGHLLRQMATPGLAIEEVFKRTRVAVKQSSNGRQIPWESTSLEGSFSFAPGSGGEAGTPSGNSTSGSTGQTALREQDLWAILVDTGTPSAYRAYLDKYPQGAHAQEARTRLAASTDAASVAPRTAAAPQGANATTQPAATRATGGFSFAAAEAELDRRSAAGRIAAARQSMATMPCPADRRKARVRVVVDEPGRGTASAGQAAVFASFGSTMSAHLRDAGLAVDSQGAAAYTVRGTVSTQSRYNIAVGLREVSVSTVLGLAGPRGVALPDEIMRDDSFAGEDTQAAQDDILQRQGAEFAAKVVRAICAP